MPKHAKINTLFQARFDNLMTIPYFNPEHKKTQPRLGFITIYKEKSII